jgi:hypothetical protein
MRDIFHEISLLFGRDRNSAIAGINGGIWIESSSDTIDTIDILSGRRDMSGNINVTSPAQK